MEHRYQGLDPRNRRGCLFATIVGVVTLILDLGRVIGDPAPGTEDLWWRQIPVLVPTLVLVAASFLIGRQLKGPNDR